MIDDPLPDTVPPSAGGEFLAVDTYKLESYLGVTLTVNNVDWLKTGATAGMTFRGGIPPREQIVLSLAHMREEVLGAAIDDAIESINQRLEDARRKRA